MLLHEQPRAATMAVCMHLRQAVPEPLSAAQACQGHGQAWAAPESVVPRQAQRRRGLPLAWAACCLGGAQPMHLPARCRAHLAQSRLRCNAKCVFDTPLGNLIHQISSQVLAVVGDERDTRDGHYSYAAVGALAAKHPLTCSNMGTVQHWLNVVRLVAGLPLSGTPLPCWQLYGRRLTHRASGARPGHVLRTSLRLQCLALPSNGAPAGFSDS